MEIWRKWVKTGGKKVATCVKDKMFGLKGKTNISTELGFLLTDPRGSFAIEYFEAF